MWKIRRLNTCEIVDDKTNRIVASGIDDSQAQAICDKHNIELSDKKWNKNGSKIESE